VPAVGKFEGESQKDDDDEKVETVHGLSALEDDAFDYVGDVFAFIHGGFNDFENFLPLDDLNGIGFFVEELGDERAADAVAFVFIAIDLDAVLEGFLRRAKRMDRGGGFNGGGDENFDEIERAFADFVDAVEDEAAGGGIDEIDDVVDLAAELVDVFAVERSDESLVELGENAVRDFVAFVLDGFDGLHLLGHARVLRKHLLERFGSHDDVIRLFGEKAEEALFMRHQPLQKSWHVV
jgi:hypothetical protein